MYCDIILYIIILIRHYQCKFSHRIKMYHCTFIIFEILQFNPVSLICILSQLILTVKLNLNIKYLSHNTIILFITTGLILIK